MTDHPVLPPEAVVASYNAPSCGHTSGLFARNGVSGDYGCERCMESMLTAAYPHLRRAILAEVVPKVVEMARELQGGRDSWYQYSTASILAALEKGE